MYKKLIVIMLCFAFSLQFEEAMSVALPICVKRMPFGREAVIKIHQGKGRWSDLTAADVIFEDNRVRYTSYFSYHKAI